MSKYWSIHTHSKYSAKDAFPSVSAIVQRASDLEYPALALTDHGNMGGVAQLYTECKKAGIKPLPGIEAYISFDKITQKRQTMHLGMVATTEQGYYNLVGMSNLAHKNWAEHKTYKAILDLTDLAEAAEDGRLDGIAATSGCWFGLLSEMLKKPDSHVDTKVSNIITSLAGWFGSGFYIEAQNHAIYKEDQDSDEHAELIYRIAQKHGLPMVIGQDSHYIHAEEQSLHDTMKRLVSWSDDVEDAVFPGDGYHMADEEWMKDHHPPHIFEAGMEGLADLESKAKVVIPQLDKFSLLVPDTTVSGDPDKELIDSTNALLKKRIEDGSVKTTKSKAYHERLNEELDVIVGAGFSGYLLLAQNVCEYMDTKGIFYNIRGSASGSLICWLLGITSFDPIVWGLRFDRFLSKDRTKPPDIDIDIEHERKEDVETWLGENFYTIKIGTWLQMGLSNEDDGEQKGSLMVRWKMNARKMGEDPNRELTSAEWKTMKMLADKKAFLGYGVHAAGMLVAPNAQSAAAVPLQYVSSSKTMVTSFDKDDIERLGLVKLDLLGLKTLTAVGIMREQTGINIDAIPLNDKAVYQAMSAGKTMGLFQLEGGSSRMGVKRLKPRKIADVIAAMALFRPATMESGATDDFINRRQGSLALPERHSIISEETKETYGVLLYQEQVIGVMRSVGLDNEEIEKARKAIKASNASVGTAAKDLANLMGRIRKLGTEKGMNAKDLNWLEEALHAYAGYGFNKAHATAYGVLAYITGYFAVHHPLAFWTGMLRAYSGAKQETQYVTAAREAGIKLFPPHVNISTKSYTADTTTNSIRKGLTTIKGLGDKAADEIVRHAPYTSLDDLARRVSKQRVTGAKDLGKGHHPESCGGIIAALYEAGALKGLERETLI